LLKPTITIWRGDFISVNAGVRVISTPYEREAVAETDSITQKPPNAIGRECNIVNGAAQS
jgi:hypothetical protein